MKKQNLQDERLVAQRRKINSEAYGILVMVLLSSILVKQFFLNATFEQYAVEFICVVGISIYTIIRHMMLGLNIFGEAKRSITITLVNTIVTGVVVTIINGILNFSKYAERYKADGIGHFIAMLIVTFISASISVFIVMSVLGYINKKKQVSVNNQLDNDE